MRKFQESECEARFFRKAFRPLILAALRRDTEGAFGEAVKAIEQFYEPQDHAAFLTAPYEASYQPGGTSVSEATTGATNE